MTIKEVSERFGVSTDTLRYYERIGLIPPVARTSGGIRDYTESDISWVEHTICMRNAGVPSCFQSVFSAHQAARIAP